MEQVRAYLQTIEEINRAEHRLRLRNDPARLSVLQSALDAAQAAWLLIPAELRAQLEPPPDAKDYSF